MTLQEIVRIEIPGMVETINEYTMEHYIRNYTTLLSSFHQSDDTENMLYVIERLIEWYEDNLNDIEHNKYIYNKHEHRKSYALLMELQTLLEQG